MLEDTNSLNAPHLDKFSVQNVVAAISTVCIGYRKFPKYSDTQNICCNYPKSWTRWLFLRVMSPNDADGMANSVDPDQTAPLGAVWSGSALFAQAYLSENLGYYGTLGYLKLFFMT